MTKKIISIFFALKLLMVSSLMSQTVHVEPVLFDTEAGLSQSFVTCLLIDSKGFIWVGTQDGLNRYDGKKFTRYGHNPLDTLSISSNYIQDIYETKEGILWIATQYGLNRYEAETDAFVRYIEHDGDLYALHHNNVFGLLEDSKGILWSKTLNGIERFDKNTNKFIYYEHAYQKLSYYSNYNNFDILEDRSGLLWMASKDGLHSFDPENYQFNRYVYEPKNTKSISHNEVRCLLQDSIDEWLWVGTQNGLNKLDKRKGSFSRYYPEKGSFNPDANLIQSISYYSELLLLVGTGTELFLFNKITEEFIRFSDDPQLVLKNITEIATDKSKIMWLGSLDGLWKIDLKKPKFKVYIPSFNQVDSKSGIVSIFADDSTLWTGTRGEGLYIYDIRTQTTMHYDTKSTTTTLPNNYVYTLYPDSKGHIWVGTGDGVMIYHRRLHQWNNVEDEFGDFDFSFMENNRIYAILEDHSGVIWFATHNGLHRFDFDKITSFYHDNSLNEGISANEVYVLMEDRNGMIWAGTNSGLNRIDPKTDSIKIFNKAIDLSKGLSNNSVLSLYEDELGAIWIGTESGLNLFWQDKDSFQYFSRQDGLANDYIYSILPGGENELWLSTNRGISKLYTHTQQVTNYTIIDKLQDWEFNLGASFRKYDGELFLGGIKGVNYFYPDSIASNKYVPKVSLMQIEVHDEKGNTLNFPITNQQVLEFPYNYYMYTMVFTLLEFTHPEQNRYKYKMEGLTDNWIELGNENKASFPKIAPGEYIFRVVGANSDLTWTNESTDIRIIVYPPFWRTKWAYTLYVLLGADILYGAIFYFTSRLRKENRILKENEEAAIEIARQKEELSMQHTRMTDSINYARRIISALMPPEKHIRQFLPESFILFMPKDIVSGDFYWFYKRNHKIFMAAVDCTGHGIPGAFMSIIGYDLLRNIIRNDKEDNPGRILDKLHLGIIDIFDPKEKEEIVKDGMDLSICIIDTFHKIVEFSGAINPLYILRENNLLEHKADRFSVGLGGKPDGMNFTTQYIPLEINDMLYMFSDGYADQFGGPRGKKFKSRRFRHLLLSIHNLPATTQREVLKNGIENWRGNSEQVDDILVIGMKITESLFTPDELAR